MRILISNDDGAFSPALWAMVRAVQGLGEVIVSAPDRDRSGVGTGLTLHDPVRVKPIMSPVDGIEAHAIEGTPGDAVILGLRHLADGPVDLVLSGINTGNNIGSDVMISGTVGAGLQGYLNSVNTVAISVGVAQDAESPIVLDAVRRLAGVMLERAQRGEPELFLNVNFPRLDDGPLHGAILTGIAPRLVADAVEASHRSGRTFYWIQRRAAVRASNAELKKDTDVWAMHHSWVSVTPLTYELASNAESGEAARAAVEELDRAVKESSALHA
ncbi:MAG: 5'/3'-nucleotidase SurE [Chloroflexota bacterium]